MRRGTGTPSPSHFPHSLSPTASRPRSMHSVRTDVRHGRESKARARTDVLADGSVVGQVELATVPAMPPFLSRGCSPRPISTGGRRRRHGRTGTTALMWPSRLGSPRAEPISPVDARGLTGARAAFPSVHRCWCSPAADGRGRSRLPPWPRCHEPPQLTPPVQANALGSRDAGQSVHRRRRPPLARGRAGPVSSPARPSVRKKAVSLSLCNSSVYA
jgi:hypothetical protein